jgi:hypothetical protein
MARVTRPETETLPLPSGETLIVRRRLNAGERRAMYAAMRGPNGRVDGLLTGQATTLAYLLDWTLKDDMSGEPLIIRGKSRQEIIAILDSLDPEDVKEIDELVDKWDDRMIAERKEEKKILNTKVSYESSSSSANDSGSATEKSTS